jgi:hypothetical protein
MPRNQLTKDQIKNEVLKIKQDLYKEHIRHDMDMKGLANRYLDKVLDKIEEYRY